MNNVKIDEIINYEINSFLDCESVSATMPEQKYITNILGNNIQRRLGEQDPTLYEKIEKAWNIALDTPKGNLLLKFYADEYYCKEVFKVKDIQPILNKIEHPKASYFLLQEVIKEGRLDILKEMLNKKMFDVETANISNMAVFERQDMLQYLLDNGLDINRNQSLLLVSAIITEDKPMQMFLADNGAKLLVDDQYYNDKRSEYIIEYINTIDFNDNLEKKLDKKSKNIKQVKL